MNIQETCGLLRGLAFRASRATMGMIRGGRIASFGTGTGKIERVLIINLDRQPRRFRRTLRELSRFRTSDGAPLTSLARRLAAVDARDGRAVAATADVDPNYLLGNQLYVQPDARLEECFGVEEPVRMTRQEVAVARSHIEAWKAIVAGPDDYVLVLEDDVWFKCGAAAAIDRGWRAAVKRCKNGAGPRLLYLSYEDAGGSAARADACDAIFRPKRGLWFLSGYVISREGAQILLRSMPVIGPVDMWINYRFEELGALALASPVILQRPDGGSDNSYSVLPYLARAGIVDANVVHVPPRASAGPVLAWTAGRNPESLAMALSMLGLRVRVFDGCEEALHEDELKAILETFDALVDAPLSAAALSAMIAEASVSFVIEADAFFKCGFKLDRLPPSQTILLNEVPSEASWQPICDLLGLAPPVQAFPFGPPREWRTFRDDRLAPTDLEIGDSPRSAGMDDSPWALQPRSGWPSPMCPNRTRQPVRTRLIHATMTAANPLFPVCVETFPGNLAAFAREGLTHDSEGAHLLLSKTMVENRPYRSGAFASMRSFGHGRFEAEIKAARGSGFVTGFFLHRAFPRQEIDVEITGDAPRHMLVNVYFNPGDDGAAAEYGYRGSPCRVDLGFDVTLDFHLYTIDWRPGFISWSVDGKPVHERVGWDPTPIPHLPMRLHANLWVPHSEELAGPIDESALPSTATFRNVSIWT